MNSVVIAVWFANIALTATTIGLLVFHKHHQKRPYFFLCNAFFLCRSLALWQLAGNPQAYRAVYYPTAIIATVLLIAVAYEVVAEVFPIHRKHLLNLGIGVLLAFAAFFFGGMMLGKPSFVQTIEQAGTTLAGCAFATVWVYARWFGLTANDQAYSVAAGGAFVLAVGTAASVAASEVGNYARIASMIGYTGAQMVWIWGHRLPAARPLRVDSPVLAQRLIMLAGR